MPLIILISTSISPTIIHGICMPWYRYCFAPLTMFTLFSHAIIMEHRLLVFLWVSCVCLLGWLQRTQVSFL